MQKFSPEVMRLQFPLIAAKKTVYLDSAATSQKPESVLQALRTFYTTTNANVHRGIYGLSVEATNQYEGARQKVAGFLNAQAKEIVFVRNATEAINLVAQSWGRANLTSGDIILLTVMEHHSNLVPWQQVAKETGATIEYIPVHADGTLDLEATEKLLAKKPKLLAVTHVSNVLGTINPIKELTRMAHAVGARVLIDACQSAAHVKIDVKEVNCDFLVFSGHKLYGPTGIGVLYAKAELLESMPPFLFGGEMIKEVTLTDASWNDVPHKFEAGTPAIAEAVALGVAIDFLQEVGLEHISRHESEITQYALEKLNSIQEVTIYGTPNAKDRGALIAFNLGDIHSHDLASVLDEEGVCIRSGHHCCMPLHTLLGIPASARISFGMYTTKEDVNIFIAALHKARKIFKLKASEALQ